MIFWTDDPFPGAIWRPHQLIRHVLWRHPLSAAYKPRHQGCNNMLVSEFQHCSRGSFEMIVDHLPRGLFTADFVFLLHARVGAVWSAEMALSVSIYLLQCGLQNLHGVRSFLLRSAECDWNNVGKLEIVFKRAWLITVVLPNWITTKTGRTYKKVTVGTTVMKSSVRCFVLRIAPSMF